MTAPLVALIGHDQQKQALLQFVREHLDFFQDCRLIATGNTGSLMQKELGLEVERVAHGPYGGDLIIGGRVTLGEVAAVFFFRDPLTAQPHEPDVSALLRVCDVHQVPLATNVGTAAGLIAGLRSQWPQVGD